MSIFGALSVGIFGEAFWIIGGFIVLIYVLSTKSALILIDYYQSRESIGLDLVSFSLVILSVFICILILFSSNSIYSSGLFRYFYVFVLVLIVVLILTFLVSNFLSFYFLFEVSLVPTLLIIMGWGYQPERLQAGLYFLFYTLGASLPLLLVIVYYRGVIKGLDFLGC